MQFCNLSVIIRPDGGLAPPGNFFWRYIFNMRIRWMKLLTALLMAVLMAVLPVCAVALEGADSQGADALLQQEDDEDSGEQAESEPE